MSAAPVGGGGNDDTLFDGAERAYLQAISEAVAHGDNDRAHALSVGLAEYRRLYRVDEATP